MEPSAVPSQLIVIGSSAGGIQALSTLLSTLAPDFPAPIVIAQHLDPARESHLREILARSSTLPVRTVEDHELLQAGTVYVVPANRHVEITNHSVGLHTNGSSRPIPSVDLLLSTAAEVFGEQLYAVILTGSGSDGADGARAVKELGGTVIIQNPETASYPGMPLSLAPSNVDIVANLEAIGPLLYDLVTGAYVPPAPDADRNLRNLLEQVRARSGIDFTNYRQPTILRRLQRRMADTGRDKLADYVRYVQRHPDEYQRLVNSFLIKVTDFFRDTDLFDYLRAHIFPELIEEVGKEENELRIWSAGCATGEEAYSLAILLAELLGDEMDHLRVRVFATDLDNDAVGFARRGIYPPSALKNLSAELLNRYFLPLDGGYEIKKPVRSMVVFGQHDLGQRAPFPRIDLALCRNVLIYFTPELQRRALQLFAFSLRPGGRLVLGKSETTSPLPQYFAVEEPRLKVYRRHGERVLIPPARIMDVVPSNTPPSAIPRPALAGMELQLARAHHEQVRGRTNAERADQLLLNLPIGVVVIDRRYDVQSINATARLLLSIHTPAIGDDFVHLAHRMDSARLRTVIDQAFAGQHSRDVFELTSIETTTESHRFVEVRGFQPRSEPAAGASETVVILVSDVTESHELALREAATRRENEQLVARLQQQLGDLERSGRQPQKENEELQATRQDLQSARAETDRLSQMVTQLSEATRDLLHANQELTGVNAELRSQNEELLVGNEESQAAAEEIETLNEEQQATNEELETLNEELHATIEELNTTNDDLEARGLELQRTAASLETERARLAELLDRMSEAAHELRTPLTTISGSLQLIQRLAAQQQTTDRLVEAANLGLSQAQLLDVLVSDLADIARLQSGGMRLDRRAVDLKDLMEQTVAVAQSQAQGQLLRFTHDDESPVVFVDPLRLQQVLLNLMNNAIRYAPGTKHIDIRLRQVEAEAEIEVEDGGVGIPAEEIENIFQRFYQVKSNGEAHPRGLGLGLFIAQEIVRAHSGSLSVRSAPGHGSTFRIRLPVYRVSEGDGAS